MADGARAAGARLRARGVALARRGAAPASPCHHARPARCVPHAGAPEPRAPSLVRDAAVVAPGAALAGAGVPLAPARRERGSGRPRRPLPRGPRCPAGDLRVGPDRVRARPRARARPGRLHPALLLRREPRAAPRPRLAGARRAQGRVGDGPMNASPLLKRVLHHSGLLALARLARKRVRGVVLRYHALTDGADEVLYAAPDICLPVDAFRLQMAFARRAYSVVSLDRLVAAVERGDKLPSRSPADTLHHGQAGKPPHRLTMPPEL